MDPWAVDGAVDMSATFVIHVDGSRIIIFVSIATTASKSSADRPALPFRRGSSSTLYMAARNTHPSQ